MAFKNLHQDLLELFSEEAPTVLGRHLNGVRRSTPLALKHERSAAWNAAHPLKCHEATKRYKAKKKAEKERRAKRAAYLRGWKTDKERARHAACMRLRRAEGKEKKRPPTGNPIGRPKKKASASP